MQVYHGPDLFLEERRGHGSDTLVVTFSHRWRDYAAAAAFDAGFFDRRKIDAFHYVPRWSHWWQTHEVPETALRFIIPALDRYRAVILYGASMGGTGALMHSRLLRATGVIALSPMFSVRPELTAFDRRWICDPPRMKFLFDETAGLAEDARYTVMYDPFLAVDAGHVALLKQRRDVHEVRLPFAGHGGAAFLKELGLLPASIVAALSGEIEALSALVRGIRAGKRDTARYWMFFLKRITSRDAAAPAMRLAIARLLGMLDAETDPQMRRHLTRKSVPHLLSALHKLEDVEGVRSLSRRAIDQRAVNARNAELFCKAFHDLRDYPASVKFAWLHCRLEADDGRIVGVAADAYGHFRRSVPSGAERLDRLQEVGMLRIEAEAFLHSLLSDDGDGESRRITGAIAANMLRKRAKAARKVAAPALP